MAVRVKIDPVERSVEAIVRADLDAAAKGRELADFVAEGIAEADAANAAVLGQVPPRTITVDGRQGAALESVNPDGGSIVVEYELVGDVLRWIAEKLIERSPQVSGAYRKGHELFADGAQVAIGGEIPQASEYVFLNAVPYARKIEVGKTESGRDFVIQVPNRIYERTATDARARFGNLADIQFAYREPTTAYRLKRSVGRRKARQAGAAVQAPAIIVRLR